jgi:hypothetical protein
MTSTRIFRLLMLLFICPGGLCASMPRASAQEWVQSRIVIDDFESGTFKNWTLEGSCFGPAPETSRFFPDKLSGWIGERYLNSFHPSGTGVGKATSAPFKIRRTDILFRIGGGNKPDSLFMRLMVDGVPVRKATGFDSGELKPVRWDVHQWMGHEATLEIVDSERYASKAYIMVDQIEQADLPDNPSAVKWFDLSSLDLTAIRQDWGSAHKNRSADGSPLMIGTEVFKAGVGTHANSCWIIKLAGNADRFRALVGAGSDSPKESILFKIYGDNRLLAQTGKMTGGSKPEVLEASVGGVDTLKLIVSDAGDGIYADYAQWIKPEVHLIDPAHRPEAVAAYSLPAPQDFTSSHLPLQTFKCVFVVASDDDGKNRHTTDDGRNGRVESVEDCRKLVEAINQTYTAASIRLEFDPATSYVRRNSTALNRQFDSTLNGAPNTLSEAVLMDPAKPPPTARSEEFRKAKEALLTEFPGRVVFLLLNDSKWSFQADLKRWVPVTTSGGWAAQSSVICAAGSDATVCIHELGHYFGLRHTFRTQTGSLAEFKKEVGQSVAQGKSLEQIVQRFDGDGLADTPADPGQEVLAEAGHELFANDGPFKLDFNGSAGASLHWTPTPDTYNWMSYYHETRLPHPKTGKLEGRFSALQCRSLWVTASHSLWLPVFEAVEEQNSAKASKLIKDLEVQGQDPNLQVYTRIAKAWVAPHTLVRPALLPESVTSVFLSDCTASGVRARGRAFSRNRVPLIDGNSFLTLATQTFEHGLFAPAPSEVSFQLEGKWNRFKVTCGLQDTFELPGNVRFTLLGDGKALAKTAVLEAGQSEALDVDVSGVKKLTLIVDDGGDGSDHDWALWLNPQLTR